MPTYVYKCTECGHMFEARQRMSDDPLTDCPNCGKSAIRRVINNVGIVFKGSGFYVTDNRNGKNGSSSSNGGSTTAKEGDSKSESKSTTEKADTSTKKSEKSATTSD